MNSSERYVPRFSLKKKTVVIIVLMAALLSGVSVYLSGRYFSYTNDVTFRSRATDLAETVCAVADPEKVEALKEEVDAIFQAAPDRVGSEGMGTKEYDAYIARFEGVRESESFHTLLTQLRGIQDVNDVESVYFVYVDPGTRSTVYLVDASADPCPPGNYDPVYDENRAVLDDPSVGFPAYITNTPEYGWLVSAGIPVYSDRGDVIAYAFADISMNEARAAEVNFIRNIAGFLFLMALVLCLAYIAAVNHFVVKPVNTLAEAASRYYEGDGSESRENFGKLQIRTGDEIEGLSLAMKQMEKDMNVYIRNLTAVTAEKERIGAELNVATQIQADMLPRIFPPFPDRKEFDIYASMNPAREVGGDFYDFFLVDDDHLALVMADVSGKGVPAALFMVIAKTLIKNRAQMGFGPARILKDVNTQLCEGNDAELFVTVWLGILEISTGRGLAANAGHEHPVIRRKDGQYELSIYRHSLAVAAMEGTVFREHEFFLQPGDVLFVYTDGVPEAVNEEGEMFGTERLLAALNEDPDATPREQILTVRRRLNDFAGDAPPFDDVTMLCFAYRGKEQDTASLELDADVNRLPELLDFVNERLRARGCPEKTRIQLDIAVEEIFVNIAHYAYDPGHGKAWIDMTFSEDPDQVLITFRDEGIPFDPLKKPDPDTTLPPEKRQIGGLGIFMVKKSMDDVNYRYEDGRNILTIQKLFG